MDELSRREFLRAVAVSAFGAASAPLRPHGEPRPLFYGRVIFIYATIYSRPSVYAATGIIHPLETILPIYAELEGEDEAARNRRWYETDGGYIHSSNVQPVLLGVSGSSVSLFPFLGEIVVPFVDAYAQPGEQSNKRYRLYYSSVFWIARSHQDSEGLTWYELIDDRGENTYFVPASAVRPVTAAELAPISPRVTDKRILIDTTAQTITALEYGRPVLTTRISSGGLFEEAGTGIKNDYRTPLGEYHIFAKRPSRHMAAGDLAADDAYDLPGVPWVSYFNGGIALHGTYWHNDFGRPWSHGCINLLSQDARWFYRWTTPWVPPDQPLVESAGTPVLVV